MAATIWVTFTKLEGKMSGSTKEGRGETAETGPLGYLYEPGNHSNLCFSSAVWQPDYDENNNNNNNVRYEGSYRNKV